MCGFVGVSTTCNVSVRMWPKSLMTQLASPKSTSRHLASHAALSFVVGEQVPHGEPPHEKFPFLSPTLTKSTPAPSNLIFYASSHPFPPARLTALPGETTGLKVVIYEAAPHGSDWSLGGTAWDVIVALWKANAFAQTG